MFRWDAKLSQQALSKLCEISVDFLRAFEANEKKPTDAQLAKLVKVLGGSFRVGMEQESEPDSKS